MSLLISGATVLDGVGEKPDDNQSIWIEAGRIKAVGSRDRLAVPASVPVFDASGKYVIPGLIDANVHLMGEIRLEHLVKYEGRYEELIVESAQVALKNGLTTVFDTWGPRQPLMAVRNSINSGKTMGSRIFCAGNIIGLDGPFSKDFLPEALEVASSSLVQRINSLWAENVGPDLTWMTPQEVAAEVCAYIRTGIDFVKYASSEHRAAEPNAFLVFSTLAQRLIVEEAHRAGITAQAHTSSVEGLRVAIEAGCDIIQHCNITGPVPIPDKTLELMAMRKTGAVVFPFTQRRLDVIKGNGDAMTRRYWSTVDKNCRAVMESGASLLLGTDAALQSSDAASDHLARNNIMALGEDNLMELGQGHFHWLKAMEEKGCPPMQLLRAATRNIAVAYGKDKDMGTLQPGKLADILILNKNPLQAAENYRTIHAIIKEGKIVDRRTLPTSEILTKPVPQPQKSALPYGRFASSRYPSCC